MANKGFKVSKLQTKGAKEVELDFGEDLGGVMTLTIVPDRLTIGLTKELAECDRTQDYGRAAEIFFGVVTDWNLADDNDEKYPLTQETIDGFGLDFFLMIINELGKKFVRTKQTAR